jgi:hypothetical protein
MVRGGPRTIFITAPPHSLRIRFTQAATFITLLNIRVLEIAMYDIVWMGWCYNPSENNDKIWGYIRMKNTNAHYSFWGKRNGTIKFKRLADQWEATETKTKKDGRYKRQTLDQMCVVFTDFVDKFEGDYAIAKLSGKIKTEDENGRYSKN